MKMEYAAIWDLMIKHLDYLLFEHWGMNFLTLFSGQLGAILLWLHWEFETLDLVYLIIYQEVTNNWGIVVTEFNDRKYWRMSI